MSQSEKNQNALQDYMSQKETEDNGNTTWFPASVRYYNKKTHNVYKVEDTVYASINHITGGYDVHVNNMPDEPDVFQEWSTKYGVWKHQDGILTIDGIDNTGTKRNYTVTLC